MEAPRNLNQIFEEMRRKAIEEEIELIHQQCVFQKSGTNPIRYIATTPNGVVSIPLPKMVTKPPNFWTE